MNIFKSLLFLEGHQTDASSFENHFTPSYGNKRASERAFRNVFTQPGFGRRDGSTQTCHAAGCG